MTREKPCQHCGNIFRKDAHLSGAQWASRMFCSKTCAGKVLTIKNQSRRETSEIRA